MSKQKKKSKKRKSVSTPVVDKLTANQRIENWLAKNGKWGLILGWILFLILYLSLAIDELAGILGGDNAHYLMLAKSLALGKGYQDLYLPGEPAHTQYPFLFPLILSPFALSARQTFYSHLLILFLGALVPLLAIAWARLSGRTRIESLVLFLVISTSPVYYKFLPNILSEAPGMFFIYLGLFLIAYFRVKGLDGFKVFYLAIVALCAFYCRTVAVVIAPALLLPLLIEPEFRKKKFLKVPYWVWFAGLFGLGMMPWLIFTKIHGGLSYLQQLMVKDPYNISLGTITFPDLILRIKENFIFHFPSIGDIFEFGEKDSQREFLSGIICLALVVIGLIEEFRKKRWEGVSFFVLFILTFLTWSFKERRFLYPLIPLIAIYFLQGLIILTKIFSKKLAQYLYLILIPIFCWQAVQLGSITRRYHTPDPFPQSPIFIDGYGKFSDPIIDFSKYPSLWELDPAIKKFLSDRIVILKIAEKSLPQEAVILSGKPTLTWYYSQRKSVRFIYNGADEENWENIKKYGVNYVLWEPTYSKQMNFLLKNPELLEVVYLSVPTKTALFKISYYPE